MFLPGIASAQMDINQIRTLVAEGKLEQALTETNSILEKDKDNMQALFMQGLIFTRMNKLDKAEEVFVRLNKSHPELPEPYNNLAVIYASQGQFEKARDALQKAINTHPSYATAHENLGDIYAKMASQAYNQALELDNSNETAREKLSLINDLFSVPEPIVKEEKPVAVAKAETPAPQPEVIQPAPPPKPAEPEVKVPVPEPVVTPAPAAPVPPVAKATPPPEIKQEPVKKEINENQVKQIILNNVDNWSKAWSRQDVDAYLSFYADDFSPDRDTSHSEWVAQRKLRLAEPGYIKVRTSNIRFIMHGDEHAQATFSQDYQSDTYSDSVTKTLLFRNRNNRWLIVQEKSE